MTRTVPGDHRFGGAPAGARDAGAFRRLLGVLRDGLYRPLAEDDDRAAYWVRHVRYGVLLSEISAVAVLVYAVFTETPARHHPLLLGAAGLVIVACPALLLLPLADMMRDSRAPRCSTCGRWPRRWSSSSAPGWTAGRRASWTPCSS